MRGVVAGAGALRALARTTGHHGSSMSPSGDLTGTGSVSLLPSVPRRYTDSEHPVLLRCEGCCAAARAGLRCSVHNQKTRAACAMVNGIYRAIQACRRGRHRYQLLSPTPMVVQIDSILPCLQSRLPVTLLIRSSSTAFPTGQSVVVGSSSRRHLYHRPPRDAVSLLLLSKHLKPTSRISATLVLNVVDPVRHRYPRQLTGFVDSQNHVVNIIDSNRILPV